MKNELRKGEVWLSNVNVQEGLKVPEHFKELKTIRLGEQAYCIHGTKLSRDYMRPLIIHKSELSAYNKIQIQRVKNVKR